MNPKYIGKHIYIINDNGESFDITTKERHFIKNQFLSKKAVNYSSEDYLEIARNSSIKNWASEDLNKHTKEVLKVYDKL